MRLHAELIRCLPFLSLVCGPFGVALCDDTNPLPPIEALASIEVRDGFQVDLVASEPLLRDPVAFDWDVHGRLWVVEMADYPLGIDGKGTPGGRVRVLTDTNDDGHYDKSSLFLDGLNFPNGIITWRDGAIITAAPDIIFASDTDGDGRADRQETLYTGFNQGNQQLRMNGLRWGLDNWIHCASGSHHPGHGAKTGVTAVVTGEQVTVGSRDFRIRPDANLIDPQSGPSQFGRNRDDWGNWFGVQNSYPLWHYVLADHYIRRNSFYAPPSPRRDLTESNPTVYPIKKPQKRFHSFENSTQFTSACSGNVYRDQLLFGEADEGDPLQHSFTCAPFHSMVQHNILRPEGTSFTLKRDPAEVMVEFFASRDRWCRPVMVRTGPDGALWIADMYRYMIEHPEWVNKAAQDELRPYYRHGEGHGRIYRVYPKGGDLKPVPKLARLNTTDLVARLDDTNGWVRDKCHQLLLWRNDRAAVKPLRELVHSSAVARLHSLCVLDGMNALDEATLLTGLRDNHAGVRQHAIRLAETHESPAIVESAVSLAGDSDDKVRLQLANSIGAFTDARINPVLAQLLTDERSDRYIRAAAMSSVSQRNVQNVALATLQADEVEQDILRAFVRMMYESKNRSGLTAILRKISDGNLRALDWQFASLAALLDELPLDDVISIEPTGNERLQELLLLADGAARNLTEDTNLRLKAISLLARGNQLEQTTLETIADLLRPQQPPSVQSATVARVARRSEPVIANTLLHGWRSYSPQLRIQIAGVLLSRESWTATLLEAIQSRDVMASDLGAATKQRLVENANQKFKDRAAKLFAVSQADKTEILQSYRAALELASEQTSGKKIFDAKCASCHRMVNIGNEVGPNLSALTDKSPLALLTSILDPNQAVDAKYLSYSVTQTDGRTHAGLIKTETASSITLLTSEAKDVTILRSDIEELTSVGRSLMPDGLEKELSLQNVADLLGYLRSQ